MTLVCAWCDTCLGEKAPLQKPGVTHGMCARCLSKQLGAPGDFSGVRPTPSYTFAEAVPLAL